MASLEALEQLLGVVDEFLRVCPGDPRAQARPGAGHPASRHLERDARHRLSHVVLPGDRPALPLQPSNKGCDKFESGDTGFEGKVEAMAV